MTFRLIEADCIEAMAAMDEASVDAVVTDPPYGLEFMGKEWDRLGPVERQADEGGGDRRAVVDPEAWMYGGEPNPYSRSRVRWQHGSLGPGAMQKWHQAWATAALRVLKPGGHLLAFGGTRTYHRLTCALEDAGFEIRDCLAWLYGSGFPKSLDVSKAIDKAAGVDTTADERWRSTPHPGRKTDTPIAETFGRIGQRNRDGGRHLYASESADAQRWQGWGTALKPAFEPIVLARKPLAGTVAQNVTSFGTGALNIDGTRIETDDALGGGTFGGVFGNGKPAPDEGSPLGRWPANVILGHSPDCEPTGKTRKVSTGIAVRHRGVRQSNIYGEGMGALPEGASDLGYANPDGTETVEVWDCAPDCPVALLDEQSGDDRGDNGRRATWDEAEGTSTQGIYGSYPARVLPATAKDKGGASRFFTVVASTTCQECGGDGRYHDPLTGEDHGQACMRCNGSGQEPPTRFRYVPKADREERNRGLEHRAMQRVGARTDHENDGRQWDIPGSHATPRANVHPTVKPVALMAWLCRLICPPGGTVLDPFTGSGSTGIAALREGFDFIGIEREHDYVEIARDRIIGDAPLFNVEDV